MSEMRTVIIIIIIIIIIHDVKEALCFNAVSVSAVNCLSAFSYISLGWLCLGNGSSSLGEDAWYSPSLLRHFQQTFKPTTLFYSSISTTRRLTCSPFPKVLF